MLPREVELVSECTGLPGGQSVKRFGQTYILHYIKHPFTCLKRFQKSEITLEVGGWGNKKSFKIVQK